MGITIPKAEEKRRQREEEEEDENEADPTDPQGKRPAAQKKKKKKTKKPVGNLKIESGTWIPVPLNEEKEEAEQIHETLERSIVKRRAPNVPYLE